MTPIKVFGIVVLSLMIAAPALAAHRKYSDRDSRDLPVQDATHFGYGSGRCGYHSGYGGLYGDGLYPDGICEDGRSRLID